MAAVEDENPGMNAARRTARVREVAFTTVGYGALVAMLALSSLDPRLAIVCAAAVVTLIGVTWFGPEAAGTAVLTLGMFTAPMTSLRPTGAIPFLTFSDLLLGLGFVLLLPRIVRTRPRFARGFTIGAWLLVVASLVPIALSPAPFDNLGYLARLVAAVVLLPLAFGYWHPDLRTVRLLAWAYVAGTIFGWVAGMITRSTDGSRAQGLTTHPNFLALTGQTAVTLLIFLYLTSRPSQRWIVAISAVVSLGVVISSGSRSGLVALAFTALVYPFANRSPRAAYVTIAAGVTATFVWGRVIASAGEGSALRRLFVGDKSTAGSNLQREAALNSGWSDFLSHPLTGGGFTERTLETHNIFLQVAQGAGIVGFLGFVLLLWAGVRTILDRGPLASLGYTALGYALVGLFQPALWDRLVWVAVALACIAATRYHPDNEVGDDPEPRTDHSARTATPIGSAAS